MKYLSLFSLPLIFVILSCATLTNLFVPQATIILSPSRSAPQSVETLQEARDVIVKRLSLANLQGGYRVTVSAENQILVELLDAQDLEYAKKLSTERGELDFVDSAEAVPEGTALKTFDKVIMTSEDVQSVMVLQDIRTTNGYQIAITLTPDGTRKTADYSRNNIGHYLIIIKDGVALSSPVIRNEILDGQAVIQGQFDVEMANALSTELQTKPLPFQLIIVDVRIGQKQFFFSM